MRVGVSWPGGNRQYHIFDDSDWEVPSELVLALARQGHVVSVVRWESYDDDQPHYGWPKAVMVPDLAGRDL